MKLCKDCKWIHPWTVDPHWSRRECIHPVLASSHIINNPVNGEAWIFPVLCSVMRMRDSRCGPNGGYWEARDSYLFVQQQINSFSSQQSIKKPRPSKSSDDILKDLM